MRPITHPIPAEWLTAYHDGELDAPRRSWVEAHLPECAACRRELEEMGALSRALASDELPQGSLTGKAAFWRSVQSQLPERQPARPAAAPRSERSVLLRWSPGIGLLLLNSVVQVAAVAGTLLMLVPARLWSVPAWAGWGYRLATGSSMGWLAWLVPNDWTWLGLFLWWVILSGGLAVLYLAWLGYELRYGASAPYGGALAW